MYRILTNMFVMSKFVTNVFAQRLFTGPIRPKAGHALPRVLKDALAAVPGGHRAGVSVRLPRA